MTNDGSKQRFMKTYLDETNMVQNTDTVEQSDYTIEQRLLLECSRTELDHVRLNSIKNLLKDSPRWKYVLEIAYRNGVLPLISVNLLQKFSDSLPLEIKEKLTRQFQERTQNNLFLTAKLLEVVQTLADVGIPILPFKGPTLAHRAYGNLSLRQFIDLDILVQPKHFDEAVRQLTKSGYQAMGQVNWLKRKVFFFNNRKDIGFISDDSLVRIELHWKLSGTHFALPFELNGLWERLEDQNIGGVQIKTLNFADLLIYLCLHGSRHGWERLAWICDLHELIRAEQKSAKEINWLAIKQLAGKHGCEKVVELGIFLVNEFFGLKTNYPEVKELEKSEVFKKIANQVWKRLFSANSANTEIGDWYWYHLTLKEKNTDKLKLHFHYFCWYLRLILKPNSLDKAVFNLPTIFYPLYFILRPSRLLHSYFLPDKGKKHSFFVNFHKNSN